MFLLNFWKSLGEFNNNFFSKTSQKRQLLDNYNCVLTPPRLLELTFLDVELESKSLLKTEL